jgi:putative ABC transport system permease protein
MQRKMIFAGLRARPVRTMVTILAVSLEVILILVVIGLTTGITNDNARRTSGVGADIVVEPSQASILLAITENSLPISYADLLRQQPGIKAVAPVQVKLNLQNGLEVVYGIDSHFTDVTGGFHWVEGGPFKGPKEIVVDDLWAKGHGAHKGDTTELLNNTFKISGVVEHGQGSRVFMSMDDLSQMLDEKKVAAFFIKIQDPEQVKTVKAQLEGLLMDHAKVRDMKEWASLMTSSNIPGLDYFINAVVGIALSVGVLVIFLSMYTTITERTREIGILRSMGASKAFIVGLIFQETTVVCIIGVIIGTVVSHSLQSILTSLYPTLMIEITRDWDYKGAVFAILSGLIGSFYPSLKAASQDPVEALAYE